MGMFSEWLDNNAQRYFGKDEGGRLAFFPYGWRRPGYYVEASDENKIKALVTIYVVAVALVNLVGSTASIAVTDALVIGERVPLVEKLEFGLIVYAISAALFYALPALLLWKLYRGLLARLCSPLTTVGPGSIRGLQPPPSGCRIAVMVFVLTGFVLVTLGAVIMLLIHRR